MKDKYLAVAEAVLHHDIHKEALAVSLCSKAEIEGDVVFLNTWRNAAIWCAEHTFHLMRDQRSQHVFTQIKACFESKPSENHDVFPHLLGACDAFNEAIENDERSSSIMAAGAAMSICYQSPALALINAAAFAVRALGCEAALSATDDEGEPLFTAIGVPVERPWRFAHDARRTAEYVMGVRLAEYLTRGYLNDRSSE